MKLPQATLVSLAVLISGALASGVAEARPGGRGFAHHGGGHGGGRVFIYAAPIFVGAYLASRYYYPPPVYVAPPQPTVYIEQGAPAPVPPQAQAYWYYCPVSRAYYPQVPTCAADWQRVAPQPPPN
jgi:hypothetical protein